MKYSWHIYAPPVIAQSSIKKVAEANHHDATAPKERI
jgi:hypothetical protein